MVSGTAIAVVVESTVGLRSLARDSELASRVFVFLLRVAMGGQGRFFGMRRNAFDRCHVMFARGEAGDNPVATHRPLP